MKQTATIERSILTAILGFIICTSEMLAGYYENAYKAFTEKNYQETIRILEEGIISAPNDEQLTFLLGQTYLRIQENDKAIDALKRTVLLDPEQDKAHFILGLAYTLKTVDGKIQPAWLEASEAFQAALNLHPDNLKYQYNYGHSLLELGKFEQAVEPLRKAYGTETGSKDYKVALDLGLALEMGTNKQDAMVYLQSAHQLNPKDPIPLKYIGWLQTKNFSEARSEFASAIELDPADALGYYNLGLASEGLLGSNAASYQELIEIYVKALSLEPETAPVEWKYRLGHAFEMESQRDWDKIAADTQIRSRCLQNLNKAREYYTQADPSPVAVQRLGFVNERIAQLETLK
jgi:tetratricopeptide (TPR) repeat protein